MRALLLNDTSIGGHVGCRMVVENTANQCAENGIAIVQSVPNSTLEDSSHVSTLLPDFDLLLINGEGTMHDDQAKAMSLGRAASIASAAGKLTVLYNTIWQNNRQLNEYLPYFNLIFCRESLSRRAIKRANVSARVVPDMIFQSNLEKAFDIDQRDGTVVIDSVRRHVTLSWAKRAVKNDYAFATMEPSSFRRIQRRPWLTALLRNRSGHPVGNPSRDLPRFLNKFAGAISGRFHGVCLCLLLDIPVLGITSNTYKTEGLLRDVGLDQQAIVSLDTSKRELAEKFDYVRSQRHKTQAYVALARKEISLMFQTIQSRSANRLAA